VVKQFLEIVHREQKKSEFIRFDRGTETMMCGGSQWALAQANDPTIDFDSCYMYGTSTANQRIESWWGQLRRVQLGPWRVSSSTIV
jgi:hypothetical protein